MVTSLLGAHEMDLRIVLNLQRNTWAVAVDGHILDSEHSLDVRPGSPRNNGKPVAKIAAVVEDEEMTQEPLFCEVFIEQPRSELVS